MARKKCPPGVFCIENATLAGMIVLVVIVGLLSYNFVFAKINGSIMSANLKRIVNTENFSENGKPYHFIPRINTEYSTRPGDTLMNPYVPPQNSAHMVSYMRGRGDGDIRAVPLPPPEAVRGRPPPFTQIGLLTRSSGHDETMLPLMGRQLHTNRSKWQYYAMSDTGHSLKIPLSKNGRSCMNEYGIDEIFNGDTVYAEGYKDAFNATIYENQGYQY